MRQGNFNGHDGVWYWTRARELAKEGQPWSAWYCYEAARYLQVPVDFLSSPNLEKLAPGAGADQGISAGWISAIRCMTATVCGRLTRFGLDASLRQADLGVAYESTGVTDPAAMHTEAIAVMSALLKMQPALRRIFTDCGLMR